MSHSPVFYLKLIDLYETIGGNVTHLVRPKEFFCVLRVGEGGVSGGGGRAKGTS